MNILGKRPRSRSIPPEFNAHPTTTDHGLNLIREFRHCIEVKPGVLSEFLELKPVEPFLSADASLHDTLTAIARRPILLEEDPTASRKFLDFLREVTPALPLDLFADRVATFHAKHEMPENLAHLLQKSRLTGILIAGEDRYTALTTLKHVIDRCPGLRDLTVPLNDGFAAPLSACTAELVALLEKARGLSSLTILGLDLEQQDLHFLAKALKETRGLTLKLRGSLTSPEAVATLLSPLPSLTGLHLSDIEMNGKDMEVLCKWAGLPDHGLRDISVEGCTTGQRTHDGLLLALLSNPGIQSIVLAGDGRIVSDPRSSSPAPAFLAKPQILRLANMPSLSAAYPWIRDYVRRTETLEAFELSCLDMTALQAGDLVDGLKKHVNLTALTLDDVSLDALPSLSRALAHALPRQFRNLTNLCIAPHASQGAAKHALLEACRSAMKVLQAPQPGHRLRFDIDDCWPLILGTPATVEAHRPLTDEDADGTEAEALRR